MKYLKGKKERKKERKKENLSRIGSRESDELILFKIFQGWLKNRQIINYFYIDK